MPLDIRSSALPRVDPIGIGAPLFEVLTALPSPRLDGIRIAATGGGGTGFATSSSPGGTGAGSSFSAGTSGPGHGSGSGVGSGGGSGNGVGNADQVDQPPREPAGNAQPEFPERERRLGIEGEVVVRLLIDETGRVEQIEFVSGPAAFRAAVERVAKTWRFEPARHRGQIVKVWGTKEVGFTLRRGGQ
jgi:protein TonB